MAQHRAIQYQAGQQPSRWQGIRQHLGLGAAFATVGLLFAAIVLGGCGSSGPSWCGPVTSSLADGKQSIGHLLKELKKYQSQPLVATYISDMRRFQFAYYRWQYYQNQVVSSDGVAALKAASRASKALTASKNAIEKRCSA